MKVLFATGRIRPKPQALARKADVAIVVVGNHPECNAGWDQCPTPSNGKEDVDRKTIRAGAGRAGEADLRGQSADH